MRHILLATDGSASANRAQWFAAALARQFSSRLTVLTVVHNEPDAELEVFGQIGGTSVPELAEQTAADVLSSAKKEVATAGLSAVETEVADGNPASTILAMATEKDIDLIVLGKRGKGRLVGLLLGSVSQKVVSLAPCPVVVVP